MPEPITERVTITRSQLESVDTLCHAEVSRGGELEPCCKDATTVLYDAENASIWSACSWHANRLGGALTLAQLAEIRSTGATCFTREVASYV